MSGMAKTPERAGTRYVFYLPDDLAEIFNEHVEEIVPKTTKTAMAVQIFAEYFSKLGKYKPGKGSRSKNKGNKEADK